jgi:hypothetical protein
VKAIDLAWISGLFEGEGTIAIVGGGKRVYTQLMVSVTNTDLQVVEEFQKYWPSYRIRAVKPKSRAAKSAWVWQLSCLKAASFLCDIEPYVRTERVRQKVALALEAQSLRVRGRRRFLAEYRAQHEGFKARMHVLNKRGVL